MSRNKPFTEYERQLAISIITKRIDGKKNDKITTREKMENWEAAASEFNNSPNIQQLVSAIRLRKFWANLKMKTRDGKTNENLWSTGGLPSQESMDNIEAQDFASMPAVLTQVKVSIDSDCTNSQDDSGDDDTEAWQPKRKRTLSQTKCIPSQPILPTEFIVMPTSSKTAETLSDHNIKSFPLVNSSDHTIIQPDKSSNTIQSQISKPISCKEMKVKLLQQQYNHSERKFKLELSYLTQLHEMELQFHKQKYELILNNLKNNNSEKLD